MLTEGNQRCKQSSEQCNETQPERVDGSWVGAVWLGAAVPSQPNVRRESDSWMPTPRGLTERPSDWLHRVPNLLEPDESTREHRPELIPRALVDASPP